MSKYAPVVAVIPDGANVDLPEKFGADPGAVLRPKADGTGYETMAPHATMGAVDDVAALTSPTAGNGSGADGTTFSGAECDALRAEVADLRTQVNLLLARCRTTNRLAT